MRLNTGKGAGISKLCRIILVKFIFYTVIEAKELSDQPLRQGNVDACLLASYAAAIFPFNKVLEIQYFIDCCFLLNIKITAPGDSMILLQPQIVDIRIGTKKLKSGYDWLEELHLNCLGASFVSARRNANIVRLSRIETENFLNNERCTSTFTLHFPHGPVHSICVLKDPNYGYVARDSGQLMLNPEPRFDATGITLEQLIFNLYKINGIRIGESMLMIEK